MSIPNQPWFLKPAPHEVLRAFQARRDAGRRDAQKWQRVIAHEMTKPDYLRIAKKLLFSLQPRYLVTSKQMTKYVLKSKTAPEWVSDGPSLTTCRSNALRFDTMTEATTNALMGGFLDRVEVELVNVPERVSGYGMIVQRAAIEKAIDVDFPLLNERGIPARFTVDAVIWQSPVPMDSEDARRINRSLDACMTFLNRDY